MPVCKLPYLPGGKAIYFPNFRREAKNWANSKGRDVEGSQCSVWFQGMLWASPNTDSMPVALHPSSCNLSCTATGLSQEAAANHVPLCGDFMLPQNIPTVGFGKLLTWVLPCKLMEPGLQPPRAMMSSFNP